MDRSAPYPPAPRPLLHLVAGGLAPAALLDVIALAVEGGVDVVQLRDRALGGEELAALARVARARLGGRAMVLVNGYWAAVAVGDADGVHLPEDVEALAAARAQLGRDATVGMSAHGVAMAMRAQRLGASYVTFGHVYATASHPGVPGRGLAALRYVARAVDLPVIAIGGIDAGRVAAVLEAGAAGVAVISAIMGTADPRAAAAGLRAALDRAAGRRDEGMGR